MDKKNNFSIDIAAKHLVVGFGATGLSLVNTLNYLGVSSIWAMDSRGYPPNIEEIVKITPHVHTGSFKSEWLSECDYLWLSPGVPLKTPELSECLKRLDHDHVGGDIELFGRLTEGNVIVGITGTNGKSTVTTLVADLVQAQGRNMFVGGNLGEPALNLWLKASKECITNPYYILELSSFQLETTQTLKLEVGAILNLAPDHLDRYESFNDYIETKFKLLSMSQNWVINKDDKYLMNYISSLNNQPSIHTFSLREKATWYLAWSNSLPVEITNGEETINRDDLSLGGLHNYANIMASCAIADYLEVNVGTLRSVLKNYQALLHRCTLVRIINGVRYYDDSKATNLPSTIAAIEGFLEPKWLILGGVTKKQDFSVLTEVLNNTDIKGIYLIGRDISEITPHIPVGIPNEYVEELSVAINKIYQLAKKGDVVLFSPACASFDQFKNFNDRGEKFTSYVEALLSHV